MRKFLLLATAAVCAASPAAAYFDVTIDAAHPFTADLLPGRDVYDIGYNLLSGDQPSSFQVALTSMGTFRPRSCGMPSCPLTPFNQTSFAWFSAGPAYVTGQYASGFMYVGYGSQRVTFSTTGTSAIRVTTNASLASVPEPASWLAMIAGFGLIGGAMRRRRSETSAPA